MRDGAMPTCFIKECSFSGVGRKVCGRHSSGERASGNQHPHLPSGLGRRSSTLEDERPDWVALLYAWTSENRSSPLSRMVYPLRCRCLCEFLAIGATDVSPSSSAHPLSSAKRSDFFDYRICHTHTHMPPTRLYTNQLSSLAPLVRRSAHEPHDLLLDPMISAEAASSNRYT